MLLSIATDTSATSSIATDTADTTSTATDIAATASIATDTAATTSIATDTATTSIATDIATTDRTIFLITLLFQMQIFKLLYLLIYHFKSNFLQYSKLYFPHHQIKLFKFSYNN